MAKLIGYKANTSIGDKLIAWYTAPFTEKLNGKWKNNYSHVEILFDNGLMFSSSQLDNAVRFKVHEQDTTKWDYFDLVGYDEAKLLSKATKLDGSLYDYLGVLGFLLFGIQNSSRWYCSEACAEVLGLKDTNVSPRELINFIKILYNNKTK